MDIKNAIANILDRLQTFTCASCGGEIKLIHTLDPTKGFYLISRRTKKAYFVSLLFFLLNPEESTLNEFKEDEGLDNIFELNPDGTFKHFYLLCQDCYNFYNIEGIINDLALMFNEDNSHETPQTEEYEEEDDENKEDDKQEELKPGLTTCENCGARISRRARRCPKCGKEVERFITCEDCGAKVPADAEECPECGGPIDTILF